MTISLDSTIYQQLAQSTEEVQTTYLDTHDDHRWWLQRVQQYTHEDQNSYKIKLNISQKIASLVLRALLPEEKI